MLNYSPSLGYGGTNAHVIMESSARAAICEQAANGANGVSAVREPGRIDELSIGSTNEARARLFVISAKDEDTACRMRSQLAEYVSKALDAGPRFLENLAYTLSARRTRFNWVSAMSASTIPQLQAALESSEGKPCLVRKVPRIGFVFNGYVVQHKHLVVKNTLLIYDPRSTDKVPSGSLWAAN